MTKLLEKLKEKRIVFFMKKNKNKINDMQETFVGLFNECGRKYDSEPMQLALTGGIIGMFLKNTTIPKKEVNKMLKNLMKKFK